MKSTILIKIKWLNRYFNSLMVYIICYNTYFGWNNKPLSDLEKTYDDISVMGIFFGFGFLIHIILSYIEFKMNKYINDLQNN